MTRETTRPSCRDRTGCVYGGHCSTSGNYYYNCSDFLPCQEERLQKEVGYPRPTGGERGKSNFLVGPCYRKPASISSSSETKVSKNPTAGKTSLVQTVKVVESFGGSNILPITMSSSEIGEELEFEKVPAMLSTSSPVSPEEASK